MKNIIIFDDPLLRKKLMPLALTRPIGSFRIGIDTLAEKWAYFLNGCTSFLTEHYLSKKYGCNYRGENVYVNGAFLANEQIANEINNLQSNEALFEGENLIALSTQDALGYPMLLDFRKINKKLISTNSIAIRQLTDIFIYNGKQLEADFQRITRGVSSQKPTDPFTVLYNESQIFIGENVDIKSAVLDASLGPIYIDNNAKIEIGSLVQGPCYIGKNSILSLGAKIRPNTTIGPFCKVGGEVSKSVIFGYSNKSHDGFMGCSVIGEWCNWGAGTNNSNLKNDYKTVDMYDGLEAKILPTGQLFAGTVMGDFSKTAIGTLLNTGTIVGVSCNLFHTGFLAKYIPSFTWGGSETTSIKYRFEKAIEVAQATTQRRGIELTPIDIDILKEISSETLT